MVVVLLLVLVFIASFIVAKAYRKPVKLYRIFCETSFMPSDLEIVVGTIVAGGRIHANLHLARYLLEISSVSR